jgi:hypothetical protein
MAGAGIGGRPVMIVGSSDSGRGAWLADKDDPSARTCPAPSAGDGNSGRRSSEAVSLIKSLASIYNPLLMPQFHGQPSKLPALRQEPPTSSGRTPSKEENDALHEASILTGQSSKVNRQNCTFEPSVYGL